MSLDVYLTIKDGAYAPRRSERIFIRRDGGMVEVTRAEWDEMHLGVEPVAVVEEMDGREVYSANITHNLTGMAREAGLYEPLWCPEEIGAKEAGDLVAPLASGLDSLLTDHERLQQFNPPNGWGDYDGLVRFTENYLAACQMWPDAEVRVWR